MPGNLLSRSLIEIAADLRAKRVTARELVETAIARHERFGERLHAYSLWAPEQARVVAKAADAAFAAGVTVGPLQGLPVSITSGSLHRRVCEPSVPREVSRAASSSRGAAGRSPFRT